MLGDVDGAVLAAREAVKQRPDDAERKELLARLQLRRGLYAELLASTEGTPSRALRLTRGIALVALGQPERARSELEGTRRAGKMTAEAASWLAVAEALTGRRAEAAELTSRLLGAQAPHAVALLARARLDLLDRDAAAAERRLREALARDPDLSLARRELATLLLSSDRAAEAKELLGAGLARSPWDAQARLDLERAERASSEGSGAAAASPGVGP